MRICRSVCLVMVALWNRANHYIFILFLSSFFFFISSPNLSGQRLDVYHTSTHGVALVRIQNACLKYAAHGSLKYRTQNDAKISPSGHHPTNLSGYIFATKACIDNRKKNLLSSNISSTCAHNMVNFGPLAAEVVSGVWGTPATFNGFRVLAALLHGMQQRASAKVCGVEQRAPPMFGRATITLGIGLHSGTV